MSSNEHGPFPLYEVLEKEYEDLYGELPYKTDGLKAEQRLAKIYEAIHNLPQRGHKPRTAICFSGGGIRSATFGLGVLQGLARRELLTEFDYLSTVSGGGYLGSWFSAWVRRDGLENVQQALSKTPPKKLQPEPEPVRHLRSYSRYMSPKLGLLSADTWTLVAIYFRNLFLNWLVLIPLIVGVLVIPRLSMSVATWGANGNTPFRPGMNALLTVFWLAVAAGIFAIAYIISNRPSLVDLRQSTTSRDPKAGGAGGAEGQAEKPTSRLGDRRFETLRYEGWFLILCLVPLLILASFITTYWAWLRIPYDTLYFNIPLLGPVGLARVPTWLAFALFGLLLYMGAYLVAQIFMMRRLLISEPFFALTTGLLGGLLTWLMAHYIFPEPVAMHAPASLSEISTTALYTCFAAPLFLLLFLLAATIFVGLSSYSTSDADREWMARAGAWILIFIFVWIVVSLLVIFGPIALFYYYPKLLSLIGIGAGAVTIGGGASGVTPANEKEETKEGTSGWTAFLKKIAMALALPIFAVFLLVVLSLGTSLLYQAIYDKLAGANLVATIDWDALARLSYDKQGLLNIIYYLPGWFVFFLTLAIVAIGVLMGLVVNINKFSLHAAYRDRLIRAYLGASRKQKERQPNPFTGFDQKDNIQLSELAKRPLHVINMTLNLVGGEKLAWQDRKAESFTASRLYAGSYCTNVGYRRSDEYGRNKRLGSAISLGTAAAISGAAASPNMGYYSSPAVTFLLALFNVRLGWWLGNPGPAGRKTYDLSGPWFAPRPLVAETLGWTNDQHPWVYLSDGGHFENLGLYEMVLRRSRIIVVSDGSADPTFTFNDLGNAIGKIREDFGIPIIFKDVPITLKDRATITYRKPTTADEKYCAVGKICYSCKDAGAPDGILIYIKPGIYGGEPADVYNYAKSNPSFPHESTGDQMYSESQFESYRMLGSFIVDTICDGAHITSIDDFIKQACNYVGIADITKDLPDCARYS